MGRTLRLGRSFTREDRTRPQDRIPLSRQAWLVRNGLRTACRGPRENFAELKFDGVFWQTAKAPASLCCSTQAQLKQHAYWLYQRNPLRCSSAISLATARVSGRRYCPHVAIIASSSEIGAANDTPNDVASTDARKTSLQARANGDRYVSAMPMQ